MEGFNDIYDTLEDEYDNDILQVLIGVVHMYQKSNNQFANTGLKVYPKTILICCITNQQVTNRPHRIKRATSKNGEKSKNKFSAKGVITSPGAGQKMGISVVLNSDMDSYFMTSAFFEGFKVSIGH